jgi:hypothetical protein
MNAIGDERKSRFPLRASGISPHQRIHGDDWPDRNASGNQLQTLEQGVDDRHRIVVDLVAASAPDLPEQ